MSALSEQLRREAPFSEDGRLMLAAADALEAGEEIEAEDPESLAFQIKQAYRRSSDV